MRKQLLALCITLAAPLAMAQNSIYSIPSVPSVPSINSSGAYGAYGSNGNTYQSSGHGYQGYNANTGSSWNAQSSGSTTRGTDSHGNSWSYDRGTGVYQNYGTGETRYRGHRR